MIRHLHWRIVTILLVFVTFAAVGLYPILAPFNGIHSRRWLIAYR